MTSKPLIRSGGSLVKGLQVSGSGLRIFGETDPNNHEPGFQPIISVSEFRFYLGIRQFLRTPKHVNTVYVEGLQLNLPPREHRNELNNMRPQDGKIKVIVDKFICDHAQLIINTLKPGKLRVKKLNAVRNNTLFERERTYLQALDREPVGNDIELF